MKRISRITKIFLLQLFVSQCINAQTTNQSIIPPSPAAMVFQKYVDYPVDISTGIPQISVPLYTIQLKDYTFPVSASFHASGRKPDFNFSPLGMNWALIGSGVINREIRGRPDESISYHVEHPASFYFPQSQHFEDLMAIDPITTASSGGVTPKDNEYDIYSLSVNGISAKFIIKDNGSIVFLNYFPYKLTGNLNSSFVLTDDKGIVYTFGFTEINLSNGLITSPTSWYLSSITTPSGSSINFSYARPMVLPATWLGNRDYKDLGELKDGDGYNANSCMVQDCYELTWPLYQQYYMPRDGVYKQTNPVDANDYNMVYLQEIDFDNGKINFSYPPITTGADFLLNSCTISTIQNKIIKTIDFSYYPHLPGTDLTLFNNNSRTIQDITFKDRSNSAVEKYSFDYYPGSLGGDLASFAKAKDLWGYCNTSTSGKQIPVQTIHIEHGADANQLAESYDYNTNGNVNCKTPSLSAKLVGMVKTIHYPTGGSTTFTYEANRILDHTNTEIEGPGIRVEKIVSHDEYGNITGKTYTYTGGTAAVIPSPANDYFTEKRIMIFSNIDFNYNTSQNFEKAYIGSYKYRQYSSEPVPEVAAASGYPVYYQSVTQSDFSSNNANNGKTIYLYSYPEYDRTYSYFSYPSISGSSGFADYFTPQVISFREWTKPQLTGKIVQKYDAATNSYNNVSATSINYITLNTVEIPQVSLYKYLEFPTDNNGSTYSGVQKTVMTNPNLNWQVYTILDRTIHSAVMKPSSETTTTYGDNGVQLNQTTNYYYDNLVHVNPTRIVTTSSDAKTLTKYITYSGDYGGGISAYSGLPIEQVTVQTKNDISSVISGQITTYTGNAIDHLYKVEPASPIPAGSFKFSNKALGILPPTGSPETFAPDSRYILKSVFTYDNKNNPLTVSPTHNNPVSYIWGYNQIYPIAEVKNAKSKNIFFTSFEDGDGNSASDDCKTGHLSRITAYTKNLTGLDNGQYILSYWKKTGSTWTLNTSSVTVSEGSYIISLTGQTDEVKFYPAESFMTSYCYDPLIGMTSQDDVNNKIEYYENDDYGRLKLIRDQDKNIRKKIDYKLVNPSFFNDAQSGIFTKQNCGPNYLGKQVTYTVPEGSYSSTISKSDANAKASADVGANGQTYANATGNCFNYKNNPETKTFTKACNTGLYGSEIEYIVPAGTYTSIISPEDAQQKAIDDVNANGQNYANIVAGGKCYTEEEAFKNDAVSVNLSKNNCAIGYTGSSYSGNPFVIPYGKYISTVSKEAADNKATEELLLKQDDVNNSGSCTPIQTINVQVSNSTYYDFTITFSNSAGTITYTAISGNLYGSVSVPGGTYNAITIDPGSSVTNTFHFYLGEVAKQGSYISYSNAQPANISITN